MSIKNLRYAKTPGRIFLLLPGAISYVSLQPGPFMDLICVTFCFLSVTCRPIISCLVLHFPASRLEKLIEPIGGTFSTVLFLLLSASVILVCHSVDQNHRWNLKIIIISICCRNPLPGAYFIGFTSFIGNFLWFLNPLSTKYCVFHRTAYSVSGSAGTNTRSFTASGALGACSTASLQNWYWEFTSTLPRLSIFS